MKEVIPYPGDGWSGGAFPADDGGGLRVVGESAGDAAAQLERAVAALSYVANECDGDLDQYCANVAPGGLCNLGF